MKRDDVIRLAKEAGIRSGEPEHQFYLANYYPVYLLKRFAAMVKAEAAAAERERAVKACHRYAITSNLIAKKDAAYEIAEAIRALGGE